MVNREHPELKDFLARLDMREKATRRKTLALIILPAIMALILLGYSILQVTVAEKRVAGLREEELRLNTKLKEKQDQLKALSALTTESTLGYSQDKKSILLPQIPPEVRERLEIIDLSKQPQGYLLVLGSFKDIESAIRQVQAFRRKISPDVKLFYAINDYYAAAQGIIANKKEASAALDNARAHVADAYLFSSSAFPYEIKLKNQ
jgi:uncharacterized small protein (DUF1192 family)